VPIKSVSFTNSLHYFVIFFDMTASADDIPSDWRITLLKDTPVPKYEVVAVQSSKAVGEPPFLLGTSVYTAIRDAIKYARRQEGLTKHFHLDSPLSSERIRMACVDRFTRAIFQDNNAAESFRAKISN
jgi:xanthine dehydrogenase molybdopterin-binding subunit B